MKYEDLKRVEMSRTCYGWAGGEPPCVHVLQSKTVEEHERQVARIVGANPGSTAIGPFRLISHQARDKDSMMEEIVSLIEVPA